jgi:hypothetical protein
VDFDRQVWISNHCKVKWRIHGIIAWKTVISTLLFIHSFISTQQVMFLKELKCNLQSGEFVVLCSFAENYSFVLQDEVQGFHLNNPQSTTICNLFQEIRCFKYRSWEFSNDIRLFEAWLNFGTYLPAASNEVNWKHIWITTEKNCLLLWWVCSPIQKQKKLLNPPCHNEDFGVLAEWHPMERVLVMGLLAL